MPTRLYLHNTVSQQAGRPIGTATADSDNGHGGLSRLIALTMSRDKGDANTWAEVACTDCVGYDLFRIFVSPALAAQMLPAGEGFRLAAGLDVAYGGAAPDENGYLRAYVYLWRPGVGKVCALFGEATEVNGVSDPDPILTPPYYGQWQVMNLPTLAADVEVKLRDRVVCEVWIERSVAATTNGYLHFNGWDDGLADGEQFDSNDSPASYLEYSGDLILALEVSMNSANILVGARDLAVDGANVGALDGGATVTYEPTHVEHTVDQRMGVQRVDKVAERMTVTAHLKEATLENLRIAWGQPVAALSTAGAKTTLHVGGAEAVTEHTLVLTGKAPGADRTRTITCHKAVAIETSAHSYTKDGATVYPVTFVLVEDATKDDGFKYMTIEDDEGQFSFA